MASDVLFDQIAERSDRAYLITVAADGLPHVVSVLVQADDGVLRMGAGRRTGENVQAHPRVTVLWPPPSGEDYSLIVDGQAELADEGETLVIRPTDAVLHQVADPATDGPGCVAVLSRD
jgi:Pyridoxamine 5'-phosphate oxidase